MSRIGRKEIIVPAGVTATMNGNVCVVKGALGELTQEIDRNITVNIADGKIALTRANETNEVKAKHGLYRALIANMVKGVSEGFTKTLIIAGVGYKAAVKGDKLVVNLGYSHDCEFDIEKGLKVECPNALEIKITGADKAQVGQFAANIRAARPVEPYHAYGVHYSDETIIRKVGKTAGKGKK
ncbi:MAG: 50S ribosomal protein L6 [Clostridiales bacterium]|nr:50S ribosomal protein L6 [Clostridiales bacterium]